MGFNSPAELTASYAAAGKNKTLMPILKIFLLGILAGALIAFGGVTANTASMGANRLIAGCVFPFGLVMVVLLGAELFTGNCLISISVLDKQARFSGMLRNWVFAYLGNFVGGVLVAALCAYSGQFNFKGGELAVVTINAAINKCSMGFGSAFFLGIGCNFLVCIAVLLAFSAKDVAGKILGIYGPICVFVICGFEHCVANMYYVPAGLFAMTVEKYATLAADAGLKTEALTWGSFIVKNLIPVTLGNIVGGVAIGSLMWYANLRKKK